VHALLSTRQIFPPLLTHYLDMAFILDTSKERLLDWTRIKAGRAFCPNPSRDGAELKRELFTVGAICLLIGGLLGYILGSQVTMKQLQEVAQVRGNSPPAASPNPPSLPEGHPVITTEGDFDNLKKAAGAAPDNSALQVDLANKLYDAGRYQDAVVYYQQALKLDPHNVDIMTDLGTALFYSGHPDEALAQYNRSLQINPRHAQALHNLVIVYLQGKKDVNAAREALNRLKSVDPANPSIASLQAMINQGPAPVANPRQRIF
jgi:tetratricopeptide (TPR) repeat protein